MTPDAGDVVIQLLGGFQASVGGRDIPDSTWAGRRSRELVQLLALADGRVMLRDQVMDALWPHLDPDAGAANLRKAAHYARQAIGDPEAVVLKAGQVSLFPSRPVAIDAARFDLEARKAMAGGDSEECGRVANTYGGELLPGSL
jgi:DNA-binding SARP family transcriptional activator